MKHFIIATILFNLPVNQSILLNLAKFKCFELRSSASDEQVVVAFDRSHGISGLKTPFLVKNGVKI